MPIYVYEVIVDDEDGGHIFEVQQKMSDPPLTHHPVTGQAVRRVFTPPNLPSRYTDRQERTTLGSESLSKHGLTRYERTSDGTYVNTNNGKGPETLKAD